MRVTGGRYRGQILHVGPDKSIRPTSDKVRQAIFNMLCARMDLADTTVCDLFCGSGSLGLEALSREADRAIFVDKSQKSIAVTRKNIQKTGVMEQSVFLKADASRPQELFKHGDQENSVDIVFIDPPFDQGLEMPCLRGLSKAEWLNENATVVLETALSDIILPACLEILKYKDYGRSKIFLIEAKRC